MKQTVKLFFWVAVIFFGAAVLHGAEGVVIEAVEKSSAGEKAGILVGDLILSWEQPEDALKSAQQKISSILDWMYLESNMRPRSDPASRDKNRATSGFRPAARRVWNQGPSRHRQRPGLLYK